MLAAISAELRIVRNLFAAVIAEHGAFSFSAQR
jgi:hypothetical protein